MAKNPEIIVKIGANSKDFNRALDDVNKRVAQQNTFDRQQIAEQKKSENELASLVQNRAKIAALAVGAIAVGAGVAIKAFADYETAIISVVRTTGLAGDELGKFKKEIDDLSGRLKTPRENLLAIAEIAGTLGVKGSANLAKFTETMAKFDIASATLKGAEAADQISRIINVSGGGIENVDRFASEIAFLADNIENVTEAGITSIAGELALITPVFKLSTTNVIALSAAFEALGISPEIVRTGLLNFGSELDKALRKGGDKLEIFTHLTGLTEQQLKKTFSEAPEKVFVAFSQGLSKTGDDAGLVLEKLGLNQDRLATLFLGSAKNSDLLTKSLAAGAEEYERNTKLNQETQQFLGSTQKSWDGVRAAVGKVAAELGEKLAPAAEIVFDAITFGLDVLYQDLNEDIPNAFANLAIAAQNIASQISNSFINAGIDATNAFADLFGVNRLESGQLTQFGSGQKDESGNDDLKKRALEFAEIARGNTEVLKEEKDAQVGIEEESSERLKEILGRADAEKAQKEADKKQKEIDDAQEKRDKEESDYQEKIDLEDERFDLDFERRQEHLSGLDEVEAEFKGLSDLRELKTIKEKARTAAQKNLIDKQTALASQKFSDESLQTGIDNLQTLFGQETAVGKAIFFIRKARAIAQAIVATNVAAAEALSTPPAPNFPLAAAAKFAGYTNVAVIAASAIAGAAEGGIVKGGTFGKDTEPFMLARDEVILPSKLNPLSPNFDQTFGSGGFGGQNVKVTIGLEESASRILTVKQREDRALGIQR